MCSLSLVPSYYQPFFLTRSIDCCWAVSNNGNSGGRITVSCRLVSSPRRNRLRLSEQKNEEISIYFVVVVDVLLVVVVIILVMTMKEGWVSSSSGVVVLLSYMLRNVLYLFPSLCLCLSILGFAVIARFAINEWIHRIICKRKIIISMCVCVCVCVVLKGCSCSCGCV